MKKPAPSEAQLRELLRLEASRAMVVTNGFERFGLMLAHAEEAVRSKLFYEFLDELNGMNMPAVGSVPAGRYLLVSWVVRASSETRVTSAWRRAGGQVSESLSTIGVKFGTPFPLLPSSLGMRRGSTADLYAAHVATLVPGRTPGDFSLQDDDVQVVSHLTGPVPRNLPHDVFLASDVVREKDRALRACLEAAGATVLEGPLTYSSAWRTAEEGRIREQLAAALALPKPIPADADVSLVSGSSTLYEPVPGQGQIHVWVHPETARVSRIAMLNCSFGITTAQGHAAAVEVTERAGVELRGQVCCPVYEQGHLPDSWRVSGRERRQLMSEIMLPCLDGHYRTYMAAFYGKDAWDVLDPEWAKGWAWGDGGFRDHESHSRMRGLPSPYAFALANVRGALHAHFAGDLLAFTEAELAIPGNCYHHYSQALAARCYDLEDIQEESPWAVQVPTALWRALHFQAVNGKLFVVTNALVNMMDHTDLEENLLVSFLRAPFQDCYFHLEQPLVYTQGDGSYQIDGFYVSDANMEDLWPGSGREKQRVVSISPVHRDSSEAASPTTIELSFDVDPDSNARLIPLLQSRGGEVFKTAMPDPNVPVREQDTIMQFVMGSYFLFIKVLIYTLLKNARIETRADRSQAVEEMRGLKGAAKEKAQRRIAELFDHIRIGPEHWVPLMEEALGGSHGSKKPHVRRGGLYNQAYGPGWSLHRPAYRSETIVNAHKLAGGEAPPAKPYIVE